MDAQAPLIVYATWDDEAKPELLNANGHADADDIPFKVVGEINEVAHREAA